MHRRRKPVLSTLFNLLMCLALLMPSAVRPTPTAAANLPAQENRPPVADSGGPYTVAEGSNTQLTASASTDPDNDPLTMAWDLDDDGT